MAGRLLGDAEIYEAIEDGLLQVSELNLSELDLGSADCIIQPSSLDLTVGQIFDPPKEKGNLGTADSRPQPMMGLRLLPGHTAVVETHQSLKLSNRVSAFGFPPAHLARKAIIMTNPGHVDPGYGGRLTFTLINLGRDTVYLDRNDRIVTLLLFLLDEDGAKHGYADRRIGRPRKTPEDIRKDKATLLNTLSPDFGDFTQRMKAAAEQAVDKTLAREEMKKYWVSGFAVILSTILSLGVTTYKDSKSLDALQGVKVGNEASIQKLEDRVATLEVEASGRDLAQELSNISSEIEELRTQFEALRANRN